ncbi:MAG: nucleotide exchange factor GrpE [Betaproteobacteria bacterium RIFCSPLOWO2_02_FULL_63_19]|nr:MAG: nucleotide exchange factor GrpE [Betaproteobacteria bacterium RIFCSPLOWO2_02_FULL_63_19]
MREELQPEPESPQDAASEQSAESTESAPDTETLLRQAELKAQESHDAWLRAKAEADNVRKRAQVDIANAHKYATETFASDLLPVKDSLEAALAAENATLDALKSGVELTLKQLSAVFDKANLRELNPAGEKFDPHRHQAISMLPSDKEPNTVINVLQKGYLLHDRVIRPALVTVAQNKDA